MAFSFQSKIPSAGMANETAQCHQVENYSVSVISPDKPPHERNLTLMQEMWSRILKLQCKTEQPITPFIFNVNVSSLRRSSAA